MVNTLIETKKGPLILLFYDGFEWRACEDILGRVKAGLRRLARYGYRTVLRKQVHTGFYAAFLALRASLEKHGCDVRVNDFAMARRHPEYPIGVAGYPTVLNAVRLPNPTIFGPGDFGLPEPARRVAAEDRICLLIQPSDWFRDYYAAFCGNKVITWFAGIDTKAWPDLRPQHKSVDVLIYDKIRWYREREVPNLIGRLTHHLDRLGLSWRILRYGRHHVSEFRTGLSSSRALAFLCEHETQGLAYQEAMASGVPIFAWDEGVLVDPRLAPYAPHDLNVSSVPYFDGRCGRVFKRHRLEQDFDCFWSCLREFNPRQYVLDNLTLQRSADAYLKLYKGLS